MRYRHTFCLLQVRSALATDCSYIGTPSLGALDPVLGSISLVSGFRDLYWVFLVRHRHASLVQVRPTLATDFCWLGAPGLCTLVLDPVLSLISSVSGCRNLGWGLSVRLGQRSVTVQIHHLLAVDCSYLGCSLLAISVKGARGVSPTNSRIYLVPKLACRLWGFFIFRFLLLGSTSSVPKLIC